jgi:hypothetical protein
VARIRSIKPEFWDDDVIGSLRRDARLLFIATWNLADDEGLLRWTSVYLKSQAFMYDDDLSVEDVEQLMRQLVNAELVFPYKGGAAQQRLAFVVHFRRHQKPNRPQPSKLPAPSLQNRQVRLMYGRRDGWECHLCGYRIDLAKSDPSPDHVTPRVEGGSDYPSNIRASHEWCNKRRGAKPVESCDDGALDDEGGTVTSSDDGALDGDRLIAAGQSTRDSLNSAVNSSSPEGRGGEGRGGGSARGVQRVNVASRLAETAPPGPEPPLKCPEHANTRRPPPCRACADARREHDSWARSQRPKPTPTITTPCPEHPEHPAGRCPTCEAAAVPSPLRRNRSRETT